jgi:hypothetical protein
MSHLWLKPTMRSQSASIGSADISLSTFYRLSDNKNPRSPDLGIFLLTSPLCQEYTRVDSKKDHDYLDKLKQTHPTLRLLAADNAPLILSFLYRSFIQPDRRSVSPSDLTSRLEDYQIGPSANLPFSGGPRARPDQDKAQRRPPP